jgi:predicted alpha/beta superfamily hydrolase
VKQPCLWLMLVLLLIMVGASLGQEAPSRFPLESKAVKCTYDIEVVVPAANPPAGTKYPVVYCMDWFILGDYLKALPKLMALGRLTEPYVLVGISQGSTSDDWAVMRTRDFTPARPTDDYSKSYMYPKAMDMTGGAANFAVFLKNELMPYVESHYPCDPARRGFVGYSLGSLLGVYVLTEDPHLFQYFLLGSPSLWFNDYYLKGKLDELAADSLATAKKVYVSVGEQESWEMLKSFDILRSALKHKGFEDARLKTEIIASSGHVGAMPISLYNGLRFLFPNK